MRVEDKSERLLNPWLFGRASVESSSIMIVSRISDFGFGGWKSVTGFPVFKKIKKNLNESLVKFVIKYRKIGKTSKKKLISFQPLENL
jgi:hypothetical protein